MINKSEEYFKGWDDCNIAWKFQLEAIKNIFKNNEILSANYWDSDASKVWSKAIEIIEENLEEK